MLQRGRKLGLYACQLVFKHDPQALDSEIILMLLKEAITLEEITRTQPESEHPNSKYQLRKLLKTIFQVRADLNDEQVQKHYKEFLTFLEAEAKLSKLKQTSKLSKLFHYGK